MRPLVPGRRIGPYEVERRLGGGGMGEVWLVRHSTLRVPRALKVAHGMSPEGSYRLLREGRLQAVAHPNVVQALDVVDVDGSPGLVLEFVEGPTLARLISLRPLRIGEIDALAVGILRGLGAAHAAGIVHRDLKPQNVLLDSGPGGTLVPRITDFGLAKLAGGTARTLAGAAFGTPLYMAPEQFRDAAAVDARADLFSLGCLLYELVAGRPPFAGDSVLALRAAMESGRYAPLSREDLPDRIARAVARCLRPDPADRPASCAELLAVWDPPRPVPDLTLDAGERQRLRSDDDPSEPAPWVASFLHDPKSGTSARSVRLPVPATGLVGRAADVTRVRALLASGRLTTIKGPGGVGKSRVALEVAGGWPGPVRWCELGAACDSGDVERIFAAARPDERDALLAVDDCDRVVSEVAARLEAWLAESSDRRALATCREPLRVPGERLVELLPLPPDAAAQLFVQRAADARPDARFDPAAPEIRALAERLEGIPLALELAAALTTTFAPRDILLRLTRRFDLLANADKTLFGTIDCSWELLRPSEQQALAQCTVFRNGFDLAAAEAVVVVPGGYVPTLVRSLVDRSLLRADAGWRYRMLDSVREYADGKLSGTERASVEARHARCYAALGQEAARGELDNLAVAAQWLLRNGDEETAVRASLKLGAALADDAPVLVGGHWLE